MAEIRDMGSRADRNMVYELKDTSIVADNFSSESKQIKM